MTPSAQDAERAVEASRARLDETVDALKDKLTPGQMFDDMTRSFAGSSGGEMFANLGSQVRDNPLPLALIGAGVALLAIRSPAPGASSVPPVGLGQAASTVSDKVGQGLEHAGETARAAAGSAADTLSRYGRDAARGLEGVLDREPLVLAALGVALGAALGAALPPTPLEDRLMGSFRDDIVDRAQDLAADGMAMAKSAADDVAASVSQSLVTAEGDARSLGEKIGQAAQAAVEAIGDNLPDPKPR
jgi:hypothetical protein